MPKNDDAAFQAVFDKASADHSLAIVEVELGLCTTATLVMLDYVKGMNRDDPRAYAVLELLSLFGTPVVDKYPDAEPLINAVLIATFGRAFLHGR